MGSRHRRRDEDGDGLIKMLGQMQLHTRLDKMRRGVFLTMGESAHSPRHLWKQRMEILMMAKDDLGATF